MKTKKINLENETILEIDANSKNLVETKEGFGGLYKCGCRAKLLKIIICKQDDKITRTTGVIRLSSYSIAFGNLEDLEFIN
jgi:hypothetical protein